MTKTSPSPARPARVQAAAAPAQAQAATAEDAAARAAQAAASNSTVAKAAQAARAAAAAAVEADHAAQLAALKQENYTALAQSQTRYQAELSIQKENHQREYAKLKARIAELEEQLAACRQATRRMAAKLAGGGAPGEGGEQQPFEV